MGNNSTVELRPSLNKTLEAIRKLGVARATDIAKITGRAYGRENSYLNELVEGGFLTKQRIGRRIFFSYDLYKTLEEVVVLKIGGGLISKGRDKINIKKIEDIADEISSFKLKHDNRGVILIHGGLKSFSNNASQLISKTSINSEKQPELELFSILRNNIMELNKTIVGEFIKKNIPAVSFQLSACTTVKNDKIEKIELGALKELVARHMIPIIPADIVLDENGGYSVISAGHIVSYLSKTLGIKKIVMATDIDGIFTVDPQKNNKAQIIPEIKYANLDESLTKDVMLGIIGGGIPLSITELIELSKNTKSVIVNGNIKGRIEKALSGEMVLGTSIIPS